MLLAASSCTRGSSQTTDLIQPGGQVPHASSLRTHAHNSAVDCITEAAAHVQCCAGTVYWVVQRLGIADDARLGMGGWQNVAGLSRYPSKCRLMWLTICTDPSVPCLVMHFDGATCQASPFDASCPFPLAFLGHWCSLHERYVSSLDLSAPRRVNLGMRVCKVLKVSLPTYRHTSALSTAPYPSNYIIHTISPNMHKNQGTERCSGASSNGSGSRSTQSGANSSNTSSCPTVHTQTYVAANGMRAIRVTDPYGNSRYTLDAPTDSNWGPANVFNHAGLAIQGAGIFGCIVGAALCANGCDTSGCSACGLCECCAGACCAAYSYASENAANAQATSDGASGSGTSNGHQKQV